MSVWGWLRGLFAPTPMEFQARLALAQACFVAVDCALEDAKAARGETIGQNRGDYCDSLFTVQGRKPRGGSWCAAAVSYWYVRGAAKVGVTMPFEPHVGAKRLARNIAKAGEKLDINKRRPHRGMAICWHRHGAGDWRGHIGIVLNYDPSTDTLWTIEGNRGVYPSKVRRFMYPQGTWRESLYMVASPMKPNPDSLQLIPQEAGA